MSPLTNLWGKYDSIFILQLKKLKSEVTGYKNPAGECPSSALNPSQRLCSKRGFCRLELPNQIQPALEGPKSGFRFLKGGGEWRQDRNQKRSISWHTEITWNSSFSVHKLECSHTCSLTHWLWLLSHHNGRAEQLCWKQSSRDRNHTWAAKSEVTPLTEKSAYSCHKPFHSLLIYHLYLDAFFFFF